MGLIVVSSYPQSTDIKDIGAVNAILAAIVAEFNGSISEENVVTGTPAATGAAGAVGSSGIALGNHTHAVQGFESLAADPASGNFVGRTYFNSVSGLIRYCTDAAGSGTFVTIGPLAAADLPTGIGARVSSSGADPIPNNGISEQMMGRGIAYDASLPADIGLTTSFADIWTGITFTCHGTQVVSFHGAVMIASTDGSDRRASLRFRESGATVKKLAPLTVTANATGAHYPINFAKTFADGSHTLSLQAVITSGSSLSAKKQDTTGGETLDVSTLQVVVG